MSSASQMLFSLLLHTPTNESQFQFIVVDIKEFNFFFFVILETLFLFLLFLLHGTNLAGQHYQGK